MPTELFRAARLLELFRTHRASLRPRFAACTRLSDSSRNILSFENRVAGQRRQKSSYDYGGRFVTIPAGTTQELASYSGGPGYVSDIFIVCNNRDDYSELTVITDGRTVFQGPIGVG